MAVHSTRRIIWEAVDKVLSAWEPTAEVNWHGMLDFNQRPPEAPADIYSDGSAPACFVMREVTGSRVPAGNIGGAAAAGQGKVSYTIHLQAGSGSAWFDTIDEEIRDQLATSTESSVVFAPDGVADTFQGYVEGWAAVTYEVPANVVGDF